MLQQFLDDMIHMTEGEKLIAYWPLWLSILIFGIIARIIVDRKRELRKGNEHADGSGQG